MVVPTVLGLGPRQPHPRGRWAHRPEPPSVLALWEEHGWGVQAAQRVSWGPSWVCELPGGTCDLWKFASLHVCVLATGHNSQ